MPSSKQDLHTFRKIRVLIAKAGPVVSEGDPKRQGGWVKVWLPTTDAQMDMHSLLCGRYDLISKP